MQEGLMEPGDSSNEQVFAYNQSLRDRVFCDNSEPVHNQTEGYQSAQDWFNLLTEMHMFYVGLTSPCL